MNNHILYIFSFLVLFFIKTNHCTIITKITGTQMKKMGWTNYNIEDLNFCINKFEINIKERFLSFISLLSYESVFGKLSGEHYNCSLFEGRKDFGNTQPGDGCRFKAVGFMELRGRKSYQEFSNMIGDENVMKGYSYVNSKYPFSTSGYYWKINNLNSIVDKEPSPNKMCKIFGNHGIDCLSKMKKYYDEAKEIF